MLVVDIEASGTEPHLHSIVSIGAFDFNNPTQRFYRECQIWEGAHVMKGALEVNGFTEAEITAEEKATEGEVVAEFIKWGEELTNTTLTGQNISFDRDFLRAAAIRAGLNWPFAYRTIDTHSLCWMHMIKSGMPAPVDPQHRRSGLNLDAVLTYCGIPEEPNPHNALTGALCHGEVASRLLYDTKLLPEFEDLPVPWL